MEDYLQKTKEELIEELEAVKQNYSLLLAQRKDEEEAKSQERRVRHLADMLPETIFETDLYGKITYTNQYAFGMFGYTPEDLQKGVFAIDFLAPEDISRGIESISNALKGFTIENKEYTAIKKDGTRFPVYIYSSVIIEDDEVTGLRGIIVDISDQKKTDTQITLMNTVINRASQPIMWVNKQGELVYINEKACAFFNTTTEESIGSKIWSFNKNRSPESWQYYWDEIKTKREFIDYTTLNSKEGQEIFIENYSYYIKVGSTELICTYSFDVTTRIKAEIEYSKISQAINQSSNSIIMTDTNGKIEYINPMFSKITGYTFDEARGQKAGFIKSGYHSEDFYSDLWVSLKSGNEWRGEFFNRKKNGEYFWESALISPIKDETGKTTGYICVKEDITEKKELELELKRALDRAEESSKLKSSLLSNMNHEVRTPLTGILGMAQILNEELKGSFLLQFAKNIIISGKRLMTTLNAILDLSELEADSMKIVNSDFFLGAQIKYSLGHYIEQAESKGLFFNFEINDTNIAVRTDQRLCNQIIMNIVDNSVKYTHNGGITIVANPVQEDGQLWMQICIKDTGIGISEEDQELIFEEFRQISEGLNRSFEGSGLGLALVKKMVNLLNGKIELKSKKGIGSQFIVYFPAVKTESSVEEEFEETNLKPDVYSTEDLPSILLVEDNEINTEVVLNFLAKTSLTEHAIDGKTAIEMAALKKYELILMDINLGTGIDGIQVAQEIRKIQGYEHTPIVAVTGYAMSSDRKKFLANGMDYYIPKPFTKDELVDLVSSILSKNK